MRAVAEMLQRNPSLVLVLLVGLPSLPWAAAYARRPSQARRRVAMVPLALTLLMAVVATLEAVRAGVAWWPPLVLGGVIAVAWMLLFRRRRAS